jgi:hypothetical protein
MASKHAHHRPTTTRPTPPSAAMPICPASAVRRRLLHPSLLGRKVRFERRGRGRGVPGLALLAGARFNRTHAARAGLALGLGVLAGRIAAVALSGGPGSARAARARRLVFRLGARAGAVERGLLAARALGLLSADAAPAVLLAAGRGLVRHDCGCVVCWCVDLMSVV